MNKGVLYGAGAYLIWGFFPLYFKALQSVPALEIMFHRVVWSFVFLSLVIIIRQEWKQYLKAISSPKTLLIYLLAAGLLAANWLVYIYGVNTNRIVETSLGYFINPLFSVALGVFFLRERLRPAQWLPVGLAAIGVIYLTVQVGSLPWIALALAVSFGLYGLLKKIAPLNALSGLTLETGILFTPGLIYLTLLESQGVGAFSHNGWDLSVLLALTGVVTALPLLMFATAARSIPLYLVGILQYIAPTCQFLLGVFLYHESFSASQLIGFTIIWSALVIYSLEGIIMRHRTATAAAGA